MFTNGTFDAAVNGMNLTPQPRVTVEDAGGNTVAASTSITLTVTDAPGGVEVNCTTNPMTTTAGIATFAGCSLTGPAATYSLHASNGTVSGDSDNIVLGAFGTATHLVFTNAAFGTVLNGAALTPQPQVTVEDAANNVVTTAGSVTLTVNGGIPALGCTANPMTTTAGVATFAGCNLTGTNGTYTLHATNDTVTGTSGNIDLATGPATHLAFNTGFGTATNATTLTPQPEVTVLDAGDNVVTTGNSITLSANELGGTVNCTTNPVAATLGVATFSGCNLAGPAGTYTLHGTNGTVTGDSGDITLAAFGAPTQLVFTNTAFGTAVNGGALSPQPQVTVEDAAGNTVTTAASIGLSVNSDGATLDCTTNPMTTTAGVATFAGCDLVGTDATYTLHATAVVDLVPVSGNSGDIVLGTGPATQLPFTNTAFGSAVNGDTIAPQPEVTVVDAGGNTVTTPNSITLTANELGGIVFCNANPEATTAGIATFAGCSLSGSAGTYTLHAVQRHGDRRQRQHRARRLRHRHPSRVHQHRIRRGHQRCRVHPQPRVTVEDAANNVVTTADSITLTVNGGVPTARLSHHDPDDGDDRRCRHVRRLQPHRRRRHLHAARHERNRCRRQRRHRPRYRAGDASRVHRAPPFDPAVNGVALAPQPQVTVEDVGGNPVTEATAITLLVSGAPGGRHVCRARAARRRSRPSPVSPPSPVAHVTGPAATYTLFATNTYVDRYELRRRPRRVRRGHHLVFTNTAFGAAVNGVALAPSAASHRRATSVNNVVTSPNSITLSAESGG